MTERTEQEELWPYILGMMDKLPDILKTDNPGCCEHKQRHDIRKAYKSDNKEEK
jgi:hypothetical protein